MVTLSAASGLRATKPSHSGPKCSHLPRRSGLSILSVKSVISLILSCSRLFSAYMVKALRNLLLLAFLGVGGLLGAESLFVSGGNVAREHVWVEFDLPKQSTANALTDGKGQSYPIQKIGNRASVLIPSLKGDLRLQLATAQAASGVKVQREG